METLLILISLVSVLLVVVTYFEFKNMHNIQPSSKQCITDRRTTYQPIDFPDRRNNESSTNGA